MVGFRKLVFAVALGLVVAGSWLPLARPAVAEWRVDTTVAPPPVLKPRMPRARPPQTEPPADDLPEAAPSERPAAEGPTDEDREEETREEAGAPPSAANADGETVLVPEPQMPQDGIIVVGEPTAAHDGLPDMRQEARPAEDIAAFNFPPAGYNPYLFSIEPVPLTDRRTREFFYLEPYYALGVRIGSFVVFPEAQIGAIHTNNIFRNSARLGDQAVEVAGNVRAVSDWRRHAVEFRASGLASFYDTFPTEDDRSYAFEARSRLDISKRTNLETLLLHQVDKDVRGLRDSPVDAAVRGDVTTDRAVVALNHRFNRLAVQLRGTITDVEYAPVPAIGGGIITNADRDTVQREVAVRTSWALYSTMDVFAEVAATGRQFFTPPDDGIIRSSTGERYRVGLSFGPANTHIRGEISAGWGRQVPDGAGLAEIDGVIVDANLSWRATALTTFLLTARSDFIDTTTTGSLGALSRQVGFEARHAFRPYLVGTAGITYTVNPYESVSINERDLTTDLTLEYYLGRETILFARYRHTDFVSTAPNSDYRVDILRVGVRVRM